MPENKKMEHAPDGPPTIERANLPHMTAEGRPDALPSDAKHMAADAGKPRPGQPIAAGLHGIPPGLHGIDASHVASERDLMPGAAGPLAHAPAASPSDPRSPQKPLPAQPAPAGGEKYLRLRMSLKDGKLSVVGVKEVPGPLSTPDTLNSEFAYEVTVDSTRISAEPLTDLTEYRSHPKPGQNEHHIAVYPDYEFTARVPASSIKIESLPKVEVKLLRFKDSSPKELRGAETIEKLHAPQVHTAIAKLSGIHLEHLHPQLQDTIRRSLTHG